MRKMFIAVLLLIALLGCTTAEENKEYSIKVAITYAYYGTYLFELQENGILEVSHGTTRNDNIKSSRYMLEVIDKKEKSLTDSELERLKELAHAIYQEKKLSIKKHHFDATQIDMLINDKVYSFYNFEMFEPRDDSRVLSDSFKSLMIELIKHSLIDIPNSDFYK